MLKTFISKAKEYSFMGRKLICAEKQKPNPNRPYIIKGLFIESQVSLLVGPPNTGKSSVLAFLAAKAALGEKIGPLRTKPALILYVAAEDPNGIVDRTHAYLQSPTPEFRGFLVHDRPCDLTNTSDMKHALSDVKKLIRETEAKRTMVVYDTLNLCIGDGDENSARDMGRVIGNAQELARETKAHVLIVHHTTVAAPTKPRGSSAMVGNADTVTVLRAVESEDRKSLTLLTQEKQRSQKKGAPICFKIGEYEIGYDDDGERQTVPMAELAGDPPPAPVKSVPPSKPTQAQLRARDVMTILTSLAKDQSEAFHSAKNIGEATGPAFAAAKKKPDSLRRAVKKVLDELIAEGMVEGCDEGYRRLASRDEGRHQGHLPRGRRGAKGDRPYPDPNQMNLPFDEEASIE